MIESLGELQEQRLASTEQHNAMLTAHSEYLNEINAIKTKTSAISLEERTALAQKNEIKHYLLFADQAKNLDFGDGG